MRTAARSALAIGVVLFAASIALAQDAAQLPQQHQQQQQQQAVFAIACLTVLPLATFLSGLAFHLFLRGIAPRRTRRLTHGLETGWFRSLAFGVVDTVLLALVFVGTSQAAKPVAILALLLWLAMAFIGLHGIARGLGARVLGPSDGPRPEVRELAVGWFVLSFVGWFPLIGWLYAFLCAVRGVGGVVLQAFVTDDDAS